MRSLYKEGSYQQNQIVFLTRQLFAIASLLFSSYFFIIIYNIYSVPLEKKLSSRIPAL
jgi:hypothetical protein